MTALSPMSAYRRPIPMLLIVLVALAVHGPLLMMQLPANSYDANLHIFMASHYAQHWFNPWNEKWFAGFSQTTYPAMQQQWIALFSHVLGLQVAYMVVQLIAVLLLPVGMYRFARIWVDERTASYAALGSVFLGSLTYLVYQAGQISTTTAAPLYLNALPYFYEWSREGRGRSLLKGVALTLAAAAAHHVTLIFGAALFALPVVWKAVKDRERNAAAAVISRAAVFAGVVAVGVAIVLLPYWLALFENPIKQMPIPHASRFNFLLSPEWGLHYWAIPYGPLILALPFVLWRGAASPRLRPLFVGFWVTFMFGLGGTSLFGPFLLGTLPKTLIGRDIFSVLTFERFTFWATLMAMPILASVAVDLVDRFRTRAVVALSVATVSACAIALGWITLHPINTRPFNVQPVIDFLNRDNHNKYRYITLGFGTWLSKVATYANASSVDGEYNSARLLPEMTRYGSAQLGSSKYYGAAGMESLRSMLKHADRYGLRYVFVRDKYYEPLLAFAGWRRIEVYDDGAVTLWSKDDVPPARKIEYLTPPPAWHGILWGILPIGSSIFALLAILLLPERRSAAAERPVEFPAVAPEPVLLREAK